MLCNPLNIPKHISGMLLAIDLCYVKGVHWTCVMTMCLYPQEGQVLLYITVLFANNV